MTALGRDLTSLNSTNTGKRSHAVVQKKIEEHPESSTASMKSSSLVPTAMQIPMNKKKTPPVDLTVGVFCIEFATFLVATYAMSTRARGLFYL